MNSHYQEFVKNIKKFVPEKSIYTDYLRCFAWGTDAGFYRLVPKVVVRVQNVNQVSEIMKVATGMSIPVTFRAAGTSLSGQAISDSVLIVAGKSWEDYEILDNGKTIRLQPGIIGARVNAILAPYGRIFGPDPASKNSAMVGGIVMNNASGMNCGVHANSDRTLESMVIVMPDGTVLDTASEASRKEFSKTHSHVLDQIMAIRHDILADSELTALIRHKYSIKNVTGLNLLPFITYDDPFEIMAHCMVGSEGTLGFMAQVTMRTVPAPKFKASAMLYFDDLAEACRAVVAMRENAPVYSCELLDRKSLESVGDNTGVGLTALLLETKGETQQELDQNIEKTLQTVKPFKMVTEPFFTSDPKVYAPWWAIRSGLFPSVGATRPRGTTALIEDIAFHIQDLPEATVELQQILDRTGYKDACIYGHALEGNYHFIIAQSLDDENEIARYKELMREIDTLVVEKYKGSLKAEHGTGRNMAPFVQHEWGQKAWKMMKRVKKAFDPNGIMNPGVIFNADNECYVKNLKKLPLTHPIADKCIECGFCEVNCTSCGFTLSARQRIVIQREISRLKASAEDDVKTKRLIVDFKYLGNQTCAGDGLCSTSCPMNINTGELIHVLREQALPPKSLGYKVGSWCADNLHLVKSGLRPMLGAAHLAHKIVGDKGVNAIGRPLNKIGLPLWTPSLPKPVAQHAGTGGKKSSRKVVYFPSCINQTMGPSVENGRKVKPLIDVMVELCEKAGFEVIFPKDMKKLCCGLTWESKGMPDIADRKLAQLEAALIKASNNGEYPVLCDQSPCLHRMRNHIKAMKLYEPAEFIATFLAPNLKFNATDEPVAVHVTCSSRLMGLNETIVNLASRCSNNVVVPTEIGCCGFAGDKGFTVPELNKWALRKLRPQITAANVKYGYSNSRTCEVGLTTNSGIPYKSIAYLVNEVTESLS